MLDNLRDDASQSPLFTEEEPLPPQKRPLLTGPGPNFLGMTAVQRFVLALMLFLMVCVMGTFFLMLTGKISPFF
jgi:hypothetical protein